MKIKTVKLGKNQTKKIFYRNNKIKTMEFYKGDKLHREDGPAVINYDNTGQVQSENYCINDKLHRKDGPAIINYFPNGTIETAYFYQYDKLHREDEAATVWYNESGSIASSTYYVDDAYCVDKKQLDKKLFTNKLNLV